MLCTKGGGGAHDREMSSCGSDKKFCYLGRRFGSLRDVGPRGNSFKTSQKLLRAGGGEKMAAAERKPRRSPCPHTEPQAAARRLPRPCQGPQEVHRQGHERDVGGAGGAVPGRPRQGSQIELQEHGQQLPLHRPREVEGEEADGGDCAQGLPGRLLPHPGH